MKKKIIIKYNISDIGYKWSTVELRSCSLPLTLERRKEIIKLYKLLAYIFVSKKPYPGISIPNYLTNTLITHFVANTERFSKSY